MQNFNFFKNLNGDKDPDDEELKNSEQDASRNYAGVSQARHDDQDLDKTLDKPLVLPSEPNLDIAHSSPGVRQLSEDEVRELIRQHLK